MKLSGSYKLNVKKEVVWKALNDSNVLKQCIPGCETFEKHPDGKIVGCVKCNHGRQNHEEEFRDAARKNEQQSQKRDADFG